MVRPQLVLYGLGALAFLGGIGIVRRLLSSEGIDSSSPAFRSLAIIPTAAGLAYLLMAFDVGTIQLYGETVYVPRYVDWLVTTPVLVGFVAYLAGAPRKVILSLAAADALMIVFGGAAVATQGPVRWTAFVLSSLCHLGLFVALYRVVPSYIDESSPRHTLFKLLQNHVGLLWLAYPVVWAASPLGLDLVPTLGISMIIAYLDVVAKVPYVYFVYHHRSCFEGVTVPNREDASQQPTGDEPAAA